MLLSAPVLASQERAVSPVQKTKASETLPASLEERFQDCIYNVDCEPAERLNLLVKVSTEMQQAAQAMKQACAENDYKLCIGSKSQPTLRWYKMYNYSWEIMNSLEGTELTEEAFPIPPQEQEPQPSPDWYQVYNQ